LLALVIPHTITANYNGSALYDTSSASLFQTVNKAPLIVIAANASRPYGAANPALTGAILGIQNSDPIMATYMTTATPASKVGFYAIVPTLSDGGTGRLSNYTVMIISGTLTITPASLTVTAANTSRIYGAANPVFTGAIAGLQNGDNINPSYSTTATPASPVGNYAITVSLSDPGNELGNYTVTINNGVLTITPAPLTVTPADVSRPFGTPNPQLRGTITGIQNTDNITASYSTTATLTSPVGTYPITAILNDPTNKLGDYSVTLNEGTLTITPTPPFYLVTTTADNGPGSLRDAIAITPPEGTVYFESGLSGTITLTSGTLTIGEDLTIAGPGDGVITVSGNNTFQVFNIASAVTVTISGLTVANATAPF
jgi:hypothetical protein